MAAFTAGAASEERKDLLEATRADCGDDLALAGASPDRGGHATGTVQSDPERGLNRRRGSVAIARSSRSASTSGRLVLKNGSTGSVAKGTSTRPWRAVQTSTLRMPSSIIAARSSSARRTGHSPNTAAARTGTGKLRADVLDHPQHARDEIGGEERRIRRDGRDPGAVGPLRPGHSIPVRPGERAGKTLDHIRHDRQSDCGEAAGVAAGVEHQGCHLRTRARDHMLKDGCLAKLSQALVAAAHADA